MPTEGEAAVPASASMGLCAGRAPGGAATRSEQERANAGTTTRHQERGRIAPALTNGSVKGKRVPNHVSCPIRRVERFGDIEGAFWGHLGNEVIRVTGAGLPHDSV